jgi:CRP-like cAMP-binding protein
MRFMEIFRRWKDTEAHSAQSVIFSDGDPAEALYVILSGEVELRLHGDPLTMEGKGGVIGEMAMIGSGRHNTTATAVTEVKLARLDRQRLDELLSESIDFSMHMVTVLANRLRMVDGYITRQIENKG